MFGHRFFGRRYYANRYFGDGGAAAAAGGTFDPHNVVIGHRLVGG